MWALSKALRPSRRRSPFSLRPLSSPLSSSTLPSLTPSAHLPGPSNPVGISSVFRPSTLATGASQRAGMADRPSSEGRHNGLRRTIPRRSFSSTSGRGEAEKAVSYTPLNEAQVPLISPQLRAQLFPPRTSVYSPSPPSSDAVNLSINHLRHHELLPPSTATTAEKKLPTAVEFDLPRLQGPTITHHFHAIGRSVAEPYLSLAEDFARAELPPMPAKEQWVLSPGWTFYSSDGSSESVPYPPESDQAMVFDVETLPYAGGAWAVMAVAVGKSGWYGWCSPWLTGDDPSPKHLVPYGPSSSSLDAAPSIQGGFASTSSLFERPASTPRLIIGHNVLYDRARIAEEYDFRRPSTRYLDTLSLHVAVNGLTNPQRPTWIKYRKDKEAAEQAALAGEDGADDGDGVPISDAPEDDGVSKETPAILAKAAERKKGRRDLKIKPKDWKEVASVNSLAEVARLHCGIKVDKTLRNVFIDPAIEIADIREHFVDLIDYCAKDVDTTVKVYQAVFPKFQESCPHPATFAGVTLMSQPVLPVDRNWPQYIERAEKIYQERLAGVVSALNKLAEEARAKLDEKEEALGGEGEGIGDGGQYVWQKDLWLRQLDWSPKRARRLPGDVPAKLRTKKQIEQAARELEERVAAERETEELEEQQRGDEKEDATPAWAKELDNLSLQSPILPLLLKVTWRGFPVVFSHSHGWLFAVPSSSPTSFTPSPGETRISPSELSPKDALVAALPAVDLYPIITRRNFVCKTLVSTRVTKKVRDKVLDSPYKAFLEATLIGTGGGGGEEEKAVLRRVRELGRQAMKLSEAERGESLWLRQLDWATSSSLYSTSTSAASSSSSSSPAVTPPRLDSSGRTLPYSSADLVWPKWYWDLDVPGQGLDVSIGKRAAPLLLKLKWKGFPVAYSKQHGWLYRIPLDEFDAALKIDSGLVPLKFDDVADASLDEDEGGSYVKLPHPDGEGKNVGSPLSKPFVAAFEAGILTSVYNTAEAALSLNASCSYWTSARERITNQMVVWEGEAKGVVPTPAAIASGEAKEDTRGLILPQVLPMGTITRRSVERTWLTASNAKKNRVGSELKSMIRAPPGYAIVGADVDSEELWICSVMGDAQFGIHGATAIGWMTLEGTKSAGTDMHSKTASILGISRDDAKVFNYSRIYGAGVKHAVVLLLKANPRLSTDEATAMAQKLYASTKGLVDRSPAFRRNFWHGGTESFVFNKLEGIAKSERPRTPALGCGLTAALNRANLPADGRSKAGEGYLPSRINWVVQSSGVDYLHLLLVSMEYLTKRYEIDARYMISVHDEVRYLVKEEDKYRLALALQIANVWTRSLFAYRLQMPDLPQGCAFFSAVDVDTCFRKEVNMTCLTPSNPDSIPFGESLDITDSLALTSGGSLFPDGRSMAAHELDLPTLPLPTALTDLEIFGEQHRVDDTNFLVAQTAAQPSQINKLWRESQETTRRAKLGLPPRRASSSSSSKSNAKSRVSAASASAAEAAAPRKRKSLRYDDDAELLPVPSFRRSSSPQSTSSPPSAPAKAEDDDEDDEDGWDDKDGDDFFESLLPDEVKRKFSLHVPASRLHV